MAVRIRNLVTSGPVVVPLSTGTSLRLSPGQITDEMPDVEVANNVKVEKLRRQGLIDVEQVAESEPADSGTAEPTTEPAAESMAEPDAPGDSERKSRSRKRTESSS